MGRLFDASELGEVAKEAASTIHRNNRTQGNAVRQTAREGAVKIRASARKTARRWGKDYPPAIKEQPVALLTSVVKPWGKAANWSFEEGSQNQPAHHNFANNSDEMERRLPFRASAAAEEAFPESWR